MADRAPSEPDVFLSYAREDEARARELATVLGQRGLSVFWDREVPPGQTWHSHIGEGSRQRQMRRRRVVPPLHRLGLGD